MNKLFFPALLLSHAIVFTQTVATDPFAKLTPSIKKDAKVWAEEVTNTLSKDLQLSYLNFFSLLNAGEYTPALIKCAEYIESQPEMHPSSQQLSLDTMQTLKRYAEEMERKIALKENLTEEQEESLWQKLEMKIQDLLAYINAIYYETLYGHITKRNPSALLYMFDENGIIPQEKRTKLLPQIE
jgi:hypothetical protein